MNAQQEAVALWTYLESRKIQPSIRKVVAMLRASGIRVNEADAARWLSAFAAKNPHPQTHRSKIPARAQHERGAGNSTNVEQIQHAVQHERAEIPAPYVRDKVSLVSKPIPCPTESTTPTDPVSSPSGTEALPLFPGPITEAVAPPTPTTPAKTAPQAVQPKTPPVARHDPRSPAEVVADTAIAKLQPVIESSLEGMTWTTWRRRNRRAAADMARSGMDADEIVAAHQEASADRGQTAMVLSWVQDRVVRLGGRGGEPDRKVWTTAELIALYPEMPATPAELESFAKMAL